MTTILKSSDGNFNILKSRDDLMIGGYASIEIVDKQNDLITLKALEEAVTNFMDKDRFRNVMTNHSNVQVGEVVKSYRDKTGKLWKTGVDDVGFFVVIKLRDDIEKAKEINRGIRKGNLRSFSIGGQALQKVKKRHQDLGEYNEISKLELHEVTICEKGINPEAKFDILKQDKGENNMSDIEKAMEELNALMDEVNTLIQKEETEKMPEAEKGSYMDKEDMEDTEMADTEMAEDKEDMEYADEEAKAYVPTVDGAGVEIGEPANRVVISGGKPTSNDMPVVKAFNNLEISSLDLDASTIEKAYEQFRTEQLEALALDNLQKTFEARFADEISTRETQIAKQNYDAQSEIADLKKSFKELADSLTARDDAIIKAQEEARAEIPSIEDISSMSWSDIHKMVGGY